MRNKLLLLGLILSLVVAACSGGTASQDKVARRTDPPRSARATDPPAYRPPAGGDAPGHEGHNHGAPGEVPSFEISPAALKTLAPTLSPEQFNGKQRLGYLAAKEIPQTLAQLPCYCHCDKGFGHKSLHTCFVDDHAAHCAVCIDEALLALQLQKQEKLSPEQIRERIISKYGSQ
ncbi:MAG TPA: CYCXC family (seleno)protein [Pyrinomonadaceae bacterium]|nr:CYCXC family (seleno)protein [Pyrinomonadaceae bacterium]